MCPKWHIMYVLLSHKKVSCSNVTWCKNFAAQKTLTALCSSWKTFCTYGTAAIWRIVIRTTTWYYSRFRFFLHCSLKFRKKSWNVMATLYRLANLKLETLKPCQRNQIFKQILRAKTKQKVGDKMRLESYSILCRFDPSRFSFSCWYSHISKMQYIMRGTLIWICKWEN